MSANPTCKRSKLSRATLGGPGRRAGPRYASWRRHSRRECLHAATGRVWREGQDDLTSGSGPDTLFGDIGRVDYVNDAGEIITRLGHTIPLAAVNPPVTSATATTLTDTAASFTTEYGWSGRPRGAGHLQRGVTCSSGRSRPTQRLSSPWPRRGKPFQTRLTLSDRHVA